VTELEDLLDVLRARGERVTTARRAVLQVLLNHPDEHLTMEQLAARVQADSPAIHLSTIYRTAEFLEESGILVNVHLGSSPAAYHFASDPHHHAQCEECGAVIAIPANSFDAVIRRLQRDHGFTATPSHVVITGTCKTCQAKHDR
jgi:Fur family ferric uptake transcriptional regulator